MCMGYTTQPKIFRFTSERGVEEEKPEDREKVKKTLEIKAAVKISNKTYKELAEIYGCCKNHIYNVVNGHSFGFLPKEPDEKYYEAARTRINNTN